ncbi:Peroxiredoxin [Cnuella takakiae]|uniref:thioredoxin-dependent peroxiredoxin n=1 Tax=Cnuella takakiae TaxID=1302690 RepID=A0A1M4VE87_9BACT|nr:peroxiredoxin-like family protein [Cnuella takakiae]OLY92627.1 hypothetical protein BUE76_12545 [Cnuella takakiae]SHE67235.1 Peroxiredoxin [Cnuella takakiae]
MKKIAAFFIALFAISISFAQGKPEGLFLNAKAPEFKLKDQSGAEVSLRDLRKKGPVVVMFYRGYWCPYCNRQLRQFQDSLNMITEKGATLVAITPEMAGGVSKTVEKTGAVFPILSDVDMKMAKAYQVGFEVDERTLERYKKGAVDLLENNGQKGKAYLPVPAVYIVNKEGSIVYRYFNDDYKKRVSVREILNEIR